MLNGNALTIEANGSSREDAAVNPVRYSPTCGEMRLRAPTVVRSNHRRHPTGKPCSPQPAWAATFTPEPADDSFLARW